MAAWGVFQTHTAHVRGTAIGAVEGLRSVDLRRGHTLLPMTLLDDHGRPDPPLASDETETLVGFLEHQRATFA